MNRGQESIEREGGEGKLMNCEVMRRSPDFYYHFILFYLLYFSKGRRGGRGGFFFLWFMGFRFVVSR